MSFQDEQPAADSLSAYLNGDPYYPGNNSPNLGYEHNPSADYLQDLVQNRTVLNSGEANIPSNSKDVYRPTQGSGGKGRRSNGKKDIKPPKSKKPKVPLDQQVIDKIVANRQAALDLGVADGLHKHLSQIVLPKYVLSFGMCPPCALKVISNKECLLMLNNELKVEFSLCRGCAMANVNASYIYSKQSSSVFPTNTFE
jgi:hypothetical protein